MSPTGNLLKDLTFHEKHCRFPKHFSLSKSTYSRLSVVGKIEQWLSWIYLIFLLLLGNSMWTLKNAWNVCIVLWSKVKPEIEHNVGWKRQSTECFGSEVWKKTSSMFGPSGQALGLNVQSAGLAWLHTLLCHWWQTPFRHWKANLEATAHDFYSITHSFVHHTLLRP